MNRLFLLRGVPGSGKSTLIETLNLKDFTISTDDLRLKLAGIEVDKYGNEGISQKKNKEVFILLYEMLEKRMKDNLDTIIDATNISNFDKFQELANIYNFKIIVVDFKITLKEALKRNTSRGYRNVPSFIVKNMYKRKKETILPSNFEEIKSEDLHMFF